MHLGRTGEAFFGDEALLRDDGDAAGVAVEPLAGAAAAAAEEEVAQPLAEEGAADAAAAGDAQLAAEGDELMFAQELDGGEAEPVSAARRSLLRCGALFVCSLQLLL